MRNPAGFKRGGIPELRQVPFFSPNNSRSYLQQLCSSGVGACVVIRLLHTYNKQTAEPPKFFLLVAPFSLGAIGLKRGPYQDPDPWPPYPGPPAAIPEERGVARAGDLRGGSCSLSLSGLLLDTKH